MTAPSMHERHPFCCHLASKKLLIAAGLPETNEDVLDASNACWCEKTHQILGPDRERCDPESCRAGRACYESPFEV